MEIICSLLFQPDHEGNFILYIKRPSCLEISKIRLTTGYCIIVGPRWLDEEELVINGDPNEVVKTLDARRDLEVAYSSDSDTSVKDSPPPDPTCARRNMETAWASVSPVSTSSISSLDSPLVSTGRDDPLHYMVVLCALLIELLCFC